MVQTYKCKKHSLHITPGIAVRELLIEATTLSRPACLNCLTTRGPNKEHDAATED